MATNQPLSLFISSKMQELIEERRAVQAALSNYHMAGWLWEKDEGARPESVRNAYLKAVETCDLYIGLFWLGYGPYTIEEFEHARAHKKPCLIYEKYMNADQRSPELAAFLSRIQETDDPDSLTVRRFETSTELAKLVQKDIMQSLTTRFRQSHRQPPLSPTSNSTTTSAKNKGIAVYSYGNITQHNYARSNEEQITNPLPSERIERHL